MSTMAARIDRIEFSILVIFKQAYDVTHRWNKSDSGRERLWHLPRRDIGDTGIGVRIIAWRLVHTHKWLDHEHNWRVGVSVDE